MTLLTNDELATKPEASPAPRVTKEYIESRIDRISYIRLGETLTHCTISLDNGYLVTGESACVNPLNYNKDIGAKIAYDNALQKLWALFGFLLVEENHLNRQS